MILSNPILSNFYLQKYGGCKEDVAILHLTIKGSHYESQNVG